MKAVVFAGFLVALSACIVKQFSTGPRLTGTCAGACDHYIECKPDHSEAARARCNTECPEVFSDEESLRGFESLSCKDTVEYVEGERPRAAQVHR